MTSKKIKVKKEIASKTENFLLDQFPKNNKARINSVFIPKDKQSDFQNRLQKSKTDNIYCANDYSSNNNESRQGPPNI